MGTLTPAPRLLGREAELRALGDAVDRVAAGQPATVLVEGEAGIGKTRLLTEALDDARARGLQVVTGRAQELERTRPFGVLVDALDCTASSPDPRRRAIAALLATQHGDRGPLTVSSDPGLQFQAVDAFADLLESMALGAPLVAGLDDLQWADPSSLLTLGSRLGDVPLTILGCLRPSPRPAELDRALEALESAGARRLPLGRLSQDTVAELVREVLAAEPGRRLLAEVAGAGGNPLFVTELVGALRQEGAIQVANGGAEVEVRSGEAGDEVRGGGAEAAGGDGGADGPAVALPSSLRRTILRASGSCPTTPSRPCRPRPSSDRASPWPSCRQSWAARPWSWPRCSPRPSGPGSWRTTATTSGSATTCSARPSMRTSHPASARPCTTRPASAWPSRAPQPSRSPSNWPVGRGRGTPRP